MRRIAVLAVVVLVAGVMPVQAGLPADAILYIPAMYQGWHVQASPIVLQDGLRQNDMTGVGDGVVWLEGTRWPTEQRGRTAFAAHTPGGFDRLDEVQLGDMVYVFIGTSTYFYRVVSKQILAPDAVQVLYSPECSMVLITCYGGKRLVVSAMCTGE